MYNAVLKIFLVIKFRGLNQPRKYFNNKKFPNYGILRYGHLPWSALDQVMFLFLKDGHMFFDLNEGIYVLRAVLH